MHELHTRADSRFSTPEWTRDEEGKQSVHQSNSRDEHVNQRDEAFDHFKSKQQRTGLSSQRIENEDDNGRNHAQQVDNNEPDLSSPAVEAANKSMNFKQPIVPGAFLETADDIDEVFLDPILRSKRQERRLMSESAKGTSVLAQISRGESSAFPFACSSFSYRLADYALGT